MTPLIKLGTALVLGAALSAPLSAQTLAGGEKVYTLHGVTQFDPAELLAFAAQIEAQQTGSVTAAGLAAVVEQMYREDGYFLATASVRSDGHTIDVDEGTINEVVVEGVDEGEFNLISGYFAKLTGKRAVNQKDLERAVMLSDDIETVTITTQVDYRPGSDTATIWVIGQEEIRSQGWATIDNPARLLGKEVTLSLHQEFHSAFTAGDMLKLDLSATATVKNGDLGVFGAVHYRFPVGMSGGFGEVFAGNVFAKRSATGTLLATDIRGNSTVLAYGFPAIRSIDSFGYVIGELRQSGTNVDVSGTLYNSDVRTAGLSWIYGKALENGGSFEYALNVAAGRRTSAAVGFDDGDQSFSYLRFGFGGQFPLGNPESNTSVRAEFWGQYSPDRLPKSEEFILGGREDERGYAFSEASGDTGISATLAVSRDLYPDSGWVQHYRPFAFLDVGHVKNNNPGTTEVASATLASVGVGVNADFSNGFSSRVHLAVPLRDGPRTRKGSSALYLSLTRSW